MAEIVDLSPVSEKVYVTIPEQIRNLFGCRAGDIIASSAKGEIAMRKVKTKKLSELLSKQKPLDMNSIAFQRKLRKEWNSSKTRVSRLKRVRSSKDLKEANL